MSEKSTSSTAEEGLTAREAGQVFEQLRHLVTLVAHLTEVLEGTPSSPGLKDTVLRMELAVKEIRDRDVKDIKEELAARKKCDEELAQGLSERKEANGKMDARVQELEKFRRAVMWLLLLVGVPVIISIVWWAWGALIHQPGTPFPIVPTVFPTITP